MKAIFRQSTAVSVSNRSHSVKAGHFLPWNQTIIF